MPADIKRPRPKQPPPPPIPKLKMGGPRIADYTALLSTRLGLLCGYGKVGDDSVLVAYLQLRLLEAAEEQPSAEEKPNTSEAYSGTLAFENGAFLIMDLAKEMRLASQRLQTFATGELKPEPMRIEYAKRFLEQAKTFLDDTLDSLAQMETASPAQLPPTDKPGPARVRARPSATPIPKSTRL